MKLIKTLLLITVIGLAGCASSSVGEPTREPPKKGVEITIDLTPQATATPQITATNTVVPLPTDTATSEPTTTSTQPPSAFPTKQATPKPKNTIAPVPAVVQPPLPPTVVVLPTFAPVSVVIAPTNPPVPVAGGYVCGDGTACIKGNINSDGEQIYHFLSCAIDTRTQIDTSKGERWFTTSTEAETAGWRRAQNCPH